jgi:hypothetical protein
MVWLMACGNSPDSKGKADAEGGDASPQGTIDGGAKQDAGAACGSVGGAYVATGSCSSADYYFPPLLCVRQSGCDVSLTTSGGQLYVGKVTDGQIEATTDVPIPQVCRGEPTESGDGLDVVCSAEAVSLSCSAKAVPAVRSDVADPCCDPAAQDCSDPAQRCTLLGVEGSDALATGCIAADGTKGKGESCARASADARDVGRDDCKKGLFCTNWGSADPTARRCQPLCTDGQQCPVGQVCRKANGAPTAGVCVATCSLWDETDSPCAIGTACGPTNTITAGAVTWGTACVAVGKSALGEACEYNDDCVARAVCITVGTSNQCSALCDDEHPCAEGSCVAFTGEIRADFGSSTGICR